MRKLIWLIVLLLFAAYCYIVWGWIQEGNENFKIDREQCSEFEGMALEAIPAGCRQFYKQ